MMSFMSKEYTWGGKLDDKNKELKWNPIEEEMEEDEDVIYNHCLFLKQAVLGGEAKDGERNIIEVETTNWIHKEVKQPVVSLRLGLNETAPLDITLIPPVTLRLQSGSGPVFLTGTHAMEIEEDEEYTMDGSSAEDCSMSELAGRKRSKRKSGGSRKSEEETTEEDEDEDEETEESMEEDEASPKNPKKKAKKEEDDEEEDEEDEDEEDEDEEGDEDEEDDDSSPEKAGKKSKKGKGEKMTVQKIKKDISDKGSIKKKEKFNAMIKSKYSLTDAKKLTELWTWYKK